ncbi:MAG: dienelactone hydrolase family protein [Holophaga sp.]|nr:dienelactone hydrolase family protein [Holophaga sp.]
MPVHSEWVHYNEHTGYLARSERAALPLPGVLVIQEIWGVDTHIEDVTRRFAEAGYTALAPDLFSTGGVRPGPLVRERVDEVIAFMNSAPPAAWGDAKARAAAMAGLPGDAQARIEESFRTLYAQVGQLERFVPALRDAVRYLSTECPASAGQPVACLGFCMGGGLSALLACEEPRLAGAAIFYGSAPPLDRVPRIQCPVAGFYGGLDERICAGLPAFAEAMRANGKSFESQVYPDAPHAFFNDTRPAYHVQATRDSFARVLEFLRRTTAT